MIPLALLLVGLVCIAAGLLRRGASWSRPAIFLGVVLAVTGFVIGGGIAGIQAGWQAEGRAAPSP